MIITSSGFTTQPQYNAPINSEWLERGLVIACNPAVGPFNQVTGQSVTNSGSMGLTPTARGRSWDGGASKYIDFGGLYSPGSGGATLVQVITPGTQVNVFPVSSRSGSGTAGIEILCGNGSVAGIARARIDTVAVTSDVTGLNDGFDHVLAVRYTPSTELIIWADAIGKFSRVTASIPASVTASQNLRLHSRATTYYAGKSGMFLYFDRPLSDADVGALLQNPSVVYEAPSRQIWVAVSSGGSTGTVSYTNANDTVAASGTTTVTGSLAFTNSDDTLAASGTVGSVSGTLAYTNADDTLTANGTTEITGSLATTNAGDTLSASGTTTITGSLATTNANDTLVASGAVGDSVTGSLAYTNANDTLSASGTTSIVGSSNAVNQNDTLAAAGNTEIKGSLATINANDTLSASGIVGSVTGTLAYTNANDSIVALGSAGNGASKAGGDDYPLRVVHKRRKKTLEEQPTKHLESIIAKAVKEVFGEKEEVLPTAVKASVVKALERKVADLPAAPVEVKTLADSEKDAAKVGELLALYQQQVRQAQMQEDEDLLMLIIAEMY